MLGSDEGSQWLVQGNLTRCSDLRRCRDAMLGPAAPSLPGHRFRSGDSYPFRSVDRMGFARNAMSPLLAQSGHPVALKQCPLLGVERTLLRRAELRRCGTQTLRRCPVRPKAHVVRLRDAIDPCRVAPRRGKMDVQVLCFRVRELALYGRFDVSALDDLPARHHSRSIKAAHGECAFAKLVRHLPCGIERFLAAANVDRKPHTVWRGNGMMLIVDED